MKKAKIAILGIAVLFAVLTVSTASAHVTVYFVPEDSSVPEGEGHSGYVEVWASVEDPDNLKAGQFAIHYDPSCINITEHPVQYNADRWGFCIDNTMSSWNANPQCWGPGYDMVWWSFGFSIPTSPFCPSPQMIANFTVECVSSEYCLSNLAITCGEDCYYCPIEVLNKNIEHLYPDNTTLVNGTFECGELPPPETFEKELVTGWNLISLPLTNATNMTVANIIDKTLGNKYDALYKYNTSEHNFVSLSSTAPMENGVGYFINMTSAGTWSYKGTPYKQMNITLKEGLNMVGWLNCSMNITKPDDALSSIAGNYSYVASWNATAALPSFETFNLVAPAVFNDFTDMERGTGYFISAKTDIALEKNCP